MQGPEPEPSVQDNHMKKRIVFISDTHNDHRSIKNIPAGDVLVHAGDWTCFGRREHAEDFNAWLGTLPHPLKIVVNGNHEHNAPWKKEAPQILSNATFLCDSSYVLESNNNATATHNAGGSCIPPPLKFYGTQFNWPLCPDSIDPYEGIDSDTAVLISHGPAKGYLDGLSAGCPALLNACKRLKRHHDGKDQKSLAPSGLFSSVVNEVCGSPSDNIRIEERRDETDVVVEEQQQQQQQRQQQRQQQTLAAVACGHIHSAAGRRAGRGPALRGVAFVNAALCGQGRASRRVVRPPVVVDLAVRGGCWEAVEEEGGGEDGGGGGGNDKEGGIQGGAGRVLGKREEWGATNCRKEGEGAGDNTTVPLGSGGGGGGGVGGEGSLVASSRAAASDKDGRTTQEDKEEAKESCFHCNQEGHFVATCPEIMERRKGLDALASSLESGGKPQMCLLM